MTADKVCFQSTLKYCYDPVALYKYHYYYYYY